MKLKSLLSDFTPFHWTLAAIAGVCLLAAAYLVLTGIGFRLDPFNWTEARADRAEAAATRANANAAARSAEAAGARHTTRLAEQAAAERAAVDQVATRLETEARTAPDASVPLDTARADRLAAGDRRLCDRRPAACRSPAP